MNERSSKFAVWMTILWLGGIFSFYIFGLFERPESFNELGDFLAGVFAPVAFLWLIYGYFQNSEGLKAQIKKANDGVKPSLKIIEGHIDVVSTNNLLSYTATIKLKNCGLGLAQNITTISSDDNQRYLHSVEIENDEYLDKIILKVDEIVVFHTLLKISDFGVSEDNRLFSLKITIGYHDIYHNPYIQSFMTFVDQIDNEKYKLYIVK